MVLLWLAAVLAVFWLAEGPRWSAPLGVAEALAAAPPTVASRLLEGWPGPAAGAVAGLLLLLVPALRRRAGPFGCTVAVAAATGIALLLAPSIGGVAAVAGVVTALLAPWLREGGLLRIAVASLVAAVPAVTARRVTLDARADAEAFAALRAQIAATALARVVVVLPELPATRRLALVRSLHRPFAAEPIAVYCVDEPELRDELRRDGISVLDLTADPPQMLPGNTEPPAQVLPDATLRWIDERGPVAVPRPADGSFRLQVVAPLTAYRADATDPRLGLQLAPADRARLFDELAAIGAEARVLARVCAQPIGICSRWQSLGAEP